MKRYVKIDETIYEIIQNQTKKCKKVLENPDNPLFDKAEVFLKELESLTRMLNSIKRLPDYPNEAMSQDDEHATHFYVQYVSSKDKLKKIIIKEMKQKHTVLSFDKNCMLSTEKEENSDARYVNVCKSIFKVYAPQEFIIKEMCRKLDEMCGKNSESEGIKTGNQLMEVFEEVSREYGYGTWVMYYVSIRKKL